MPDNEKRMASAEDAQEVLRHIREAAITLAHALECFPEYAKSWHEALVTEMSNCGIEPALAHRAASNFMFRGFGVRYPTN